MATLHLGSVADTTVTVWDGEGGRCSNSVCVENVVDYCKLGYVVNKQTMDN